MFNFSLSESLRRLFVRPSVRQSVIDESYFPLFLVASVWEILIQEKTHWHSN